jgi:CDP-diacylglycerol--glycerol-3-phosphate 3-phosphatidyltransferase
MSSIVSPALRQRVRAGIEQPVGRFFSRLGLTPNALTLIGFGIAVVAALFAARADWLLAGVLVGVGAVFDLFDGALARSTGRTSRFGAFMDSTFDRAGEAVVYIGIAAGLGQPGIEGANGAQLLAIAALAASLMVSYTRAKSESLGFSPGTGMANIGLAPREVRLVILVIGLVAAGLASGGTAGAGGAALWAALAVVAGLATLTTIQRIVFTYRQAKSQEDNE